MIRLTDADIAEHKKLAKDLRLHAKAMDEMARADRERHDSLSERMWKAEAREHRRRAREHDELVKDEHFWRRMDRVDAKRRYRAAVAVLEETPA